MPVRCAMGDGGVGCGWLQHKPKDMIHLQYIVSLNKVLNHQFIPFNTWRQMRNENLQWTLIDLMNGDGMVGSFGSGVIWERAK